MKKIMAIARKDLITTFRDPAALVIMLVTPFALTLAIAFAFGGLGGGGNAGLSDIPVAIVNHDTGEFGSYLVDVFESDELADLLAPSRAADDAAARAMVDADDAAAAVLIPANFSASIVAAGLAAPREQSVVEVYANPTRPISAAVARGIVDRFLSQVAAGQAAGQVAVTQLLMSGALAPAEAATLGREIGERAGREPAGASPIQIEREMAGEEGGGGFDWLSYMAPSMAILFLMFTATAGGRSLLVERDAGTLPRMLTTPTRPAQVVGGKVFGTYLTGVAQVGILVAASGLLFGVKWGDLAAVGLLVLALVAGATAWGMFIASFSRSAGQANAVGTMVTLTFGGLAGNFIPRQLLPEVLQKASYISPNAWGLEGFSRIAAGGTLGDVVAPVLALLLMAAVLFGVAVVAFRRQYA